jgi:hypothetical protein
MFTDEIPEFFKLLNQDQTVYIFVTNPTYHYCLSKDNNVRCARYKIKEKGKQPLPGLTPDGQNVNIADSLIMRKITLEGSP